MSGGSDRIFLSPPDVTGRERALVEEAFDSNFIAPAGPMLGRFEAAAADYTGFAHAVALSSGTAALHLALLIHGVGPGDRVWVPSMTFIGGAAPIRYLGAEPVFFDLERESWNIDPALVADALEAASREGGLPKAIVTADLYGQCCDLAPVLDAAARYEIPVISDSAEALGAFRDGRHSGRGARAALLSFNGNKIISSSGGGMLLSDDRGLIDRARYLSTQARQPVAHYEHVEIGFNYRMSNVSAAIGLGQIEQIEQKVARRRAVFERYRDAFGDRLDFMPEPPSCRSTRWLTCALAPDGALRDRVIDELERDSIESRPLWKPMHLQPVFSGTRFVGDGFCVDLFERGLCLPSGSGLSEPDQRRVIDAVLRALDG